MSSWRFRTPQDSFYNRVYARPATYASSRPLEDTHTPQCRARRDQLSELNAANSPLLRLPAELRNTIYTYVFSSTACGFVDHNNDRDFDPGQIFSFHRCNFGLVATSRQLYAETALLPYKLGLFQFFLHSPRAPWEVYVRAFIGSRSEEQLRAMGEEFEVVGYDPETRHDRPYWGTGLQWADAFAKNDVKALCPEWYRRRVGEISDT